LSLSERLRSLLHCDWKVAKHVVHPSLGDLRELLSCGVSSVTDFELFAHICCCLRFLQAIQHQLLCPPPLSKTSAPFSPPSFLANMSIKEPRSVFDRPAQISPSRPASVFSAQSIDTVVADTSYRGFPSEEAYLNALKAWANSKMFYEADDQLSGYYGKKTVDDILLKQGTTRGAKKTPRSQRRATVAPQLDTVAEHNGSASALSRQSSANVAADSTDAPAEGKASKLKRVFTRRKTVA